MKYLPTIASILLGLLFLMASLTYLLHMVPMPKIPEGTPQAMFMGAFGPTGYMTFVKICELVGAILVLIPRTRYLSLLVLGPVIVNILAYAILIDKSALNPITFAVAALALYLLWVGRHAFAGLLNK
jgi:hypothetical protein